MTQVSYNHPNPTYYLRSAAAAANIDRIALDRLARLDRRHAITHDTYAGVWFAAAYELLPDAVLDDTAIVDYEANRFATYHRAAIAAGETARLAGEAEGTAELLAHAD